MENTYENAHFRLSNRCQGLTDSTKPVEKKSPDSSKVTNILLATLSLLLLIFGGVICFLTVLYFNKLALVDKLSEQHFNAEARLTMHEYNTNETERKCELLQVRYNRLHKIFSNCTGCENCGYCENGWRRFGIKCYYFSTGKANWTESRDFCAKNESHMVIITSKGEQDFVTSHIKETHWIGLNDLEIEGTWMWVNNVPLNQTGVNFWHKSEPDNWKKEDPSGENCACLGTEDGFLKYWMDSSCRKSKKFICEK